MNEQLSGKRCPFCNCAFTDEDEIVICSDCEMPHHKECWIENQGCSTYGCNGTIQSAGQGSASTGSVQINLSSPTRSCDRCGQAIEEGAAFCSGCGSRIEAVPAAPQGPKFCAHCGKAIDPGAAFCSGCGSRVEAVPAAPQAQYQQPFQPPTPPLAANGLPNAAFCQQSDEAANKSISVLCYFGLLVLIPLLRSPKSPFVRFHANQGIVYSIFTFLFYIFTRFPILNVFGYLGLLVCFVLGITGIANCLKMQKKELPVIGRIKLLK